MARPESSGTAEDSARHGEQQGVIVEHFARFSPELVRGFAKQGEGFGSDIEVKGMLLCVGTRYS